MKNIYAYLAGAIDSDGTIGIKKSTYAMRVVGDCKNATYSERIALRQVTIEIPALLKATFGGSFYMTNPSAKGGRRLYSWAATDLRAVEALKKLRPFLRVKVKQADNCLELRKIKEISKKRRVAKKRGHIGAATRTSDLSDKMEAFYLEAKAMNVVGVPVNTHFPSPL